MTPPKIIDHLIQRITGWGVWESDEARTAWLAPQTARLAGIGVPDYAAERRIAFTLVDYAVRVCAAEAMDAAGRKAEGNALRACAPIRDRKTAQAGRQVARGAYLTASAAAAAVYAATYVAGSDAPAAHSAYAAAHASDAACAATRARARAHVRAAFALAAEYAVAAAAAGGPAAFPRHADALIDRAINAATRAP